MIGAMPGTPLTLRWRLLALALIGQVAYAAIAADDAAYIKDLAERVNRYRVLKSLPKLLPNATLDALAREHSAAMARAASLNHDDFPSRVRRSGLAMCVENIGWNYHSASGQFEGWRTSPGHERNMLAAKAEAMGIGVVDDYVTMIACGK
jgi:uncharacterized protein YkwD